MILTQQFIHEKLLDYLSRAETTRFLLVNKIVKYSVKKLDVSFEEARTLLSANGLEEELASLEKLGYLSDERFCEGYTRSKQEQGYGYRYIYSKLLQKGVDSTLIKQKLDSFDWADNQLEDIRSRKFGAELPNDYKLRNKQIRFLLSKGFEADEVLQLFK